MIDDDARLRRVTDESLKFSTCNKPRRAAFGVLGNMIKREKKRVQMIDNAFFVVVQY